MFICLYVDDVLIMAKEMNHIMEMFKFLKDHFKIHHMGVISEYLGTQFEFISHDKLLCIRREIF